MAIPKFNQIRVPILRILSKGKPLKTKDFLSPLTEYFQLTEEEQNAMYPSGNGYIFYDRISWALSYLYMAQLIDKPQRGLYIITSKGISMQANKSDEQINDYIEKAVQTRSLLKKKNGDTVQEPSIVADNQSDITPKEILYTSFNNIKKTVYSEILATIISKSPREFERLVVKLLQTMGYGGEIKDSGHVTKPTNDGGIDGIIKEDVLGFGRIYIQAKRYALNNAIQRDEIQKFVGALAVSQSNKGVFITTSHFTQGAVDYVNNLNGSSATIVLIDGKKLAEYIYDFGLGMQLEQTIEIKKLDTDFWDLMEVDPSKNTID